MARTPRTSRSKRTPLGDDPSTIRNPNARPRAGSLAPVKRVLPAIDWRPEEYAAVRFELQRGEDPPGMDVIGGSVWELVYRCIYPDGVFDKIARFQRIVAMSRQEVIDALQRLMYGFAERIVLYHVRNLRKGTADERG